MSHYAANSIISFFLVLDTPHDFPIEYILHVHYVSSVKIRTKFLIIIRYFPSILYKMSLEPGVGPTMSILQFSACTGVLFKCSMSKMVSPGNGKSTLSLSGRRLEQSALPFFLPSLYNISYSYPARIRAHL